MQHDAKVADGSRVLTFSCSIMSPVEGGRNFGARAIGVRLGRWHRSDPRSLRRTNAAGAGFPPRHSIKEHYSREHTPPRRCKDGGKPLRDDESQQRNGSPQKYEEDLSHTILFAVPPRTDALLFWSRYGQILAPNVAAAKLFQQETATRCRSEAVAPLMA